MFFQRVEHCAGWRRRHVGRKQTAPYFLGVTAPFGRRGFAMDCLPPGEYTRVAHYQRRRAPGERAMGERIQVDEIRLQLVLQLTQPLTGPADVEPRVGHPFQLEVALKYLEVRQGAG